MKFFLPALMVCLQLSARPIQISGIYPHLAMFNNEGECGTGAVVPWADRLWVISYAPHKPEGSSDKLYEITPDLEQIIRPESIGGTPANRMIHRESGQLFIGPHAIALDRTVRTIPYNVMYGRPTGLARHLTDPAHKIVFATMEEGIYEVDVKTLAVHELWADEQRKTGRKANLPGYHGKGFYSAQGRYVYANNGDHASAALSDPTVPSGVLAEWDGKAPAWTVVRRNQFTEVTGPGGIMGNSPDDDRLWSIGWDSRSLILMLLDHGKWTAYRLPKASHTYDGAHGWNTEWPRIRDVGQSSLLMTMHGQFWKFPKTFSAGDTAGIAPYSTYLKVIGDFSRWGKTIVFGCDDTAKSEFLNKDPLKGSLAGPGRSQSNLWFVEPDQLDDFGPPLGRGAVWQDDNVNASQASDSFLFSGYDYRSLYLAHQGSERVTVKMEVDRKGNGKWTTLREVQLPSNGNAWVEFTSSETGAWIRLVPSANLKHATAYFHYRGQDKRDTGNKTLLAGMSPAPASIAPGLLHARAGEAKTLRMVFAGSGTQPSGYDLDEQLKLTPVDDAAGNAWVVTNIALAKPMFQSDAASILYVDPKGNRWRLPSGSTNIPAAAQGRVSREVCTERNLLNVGGTFYELPAQNAGGFIRVRPISTHNRAIYDYASYRGMLILSGIDPADSGSHVVRSSDGKAAIWAGAVDDLWAFGKPRGHGGPWLQTEVKAGQPSDPYLATGFDQKELTLSHASNQPVTFTVEADFTGTGRWAVFRSVEVPANETVRYRFPDAFGAYWLRVKSSAPTTATAQFDYK